MRRYFLFLLLIIIVLLPQFSFAEERGDLHVRIQEINVHAGGSLHVALFREEKGWPKLKAAWQIHDVAATERTMEVLFKNLPYAENYAVEIHHDENSNGKFDMRWFPYPRPREGVGVSNNRFGFGPPDFNEACFSLDVSRKSLSILMRY